jgi:tagaturonate reductase
MHRTDLMQLTKNTIKQVSPKDGLKIADERLFELPEKVLQFGTGVLLRALPDYFIDKANKQGIFNGRVVVVKSTDGDSSAFDKQNGLYTICIRGVEDSKPVEENIINASISRVLTAGTEWQKILDCASNPEMKIIISNTTEVGIQLLQDDITAKPPLSFPGKLLSFLFERYKAFNGSKESGMIIIPTELISDNGTKLESIVLELAHLNNLEFNFIEWLEKHNTFCNSLVDRIVPGKPNMEETKRIEASLGYEDELMTTSEVFRLWAIEGDEKVKEALSFSETDEGIIIAPDINIFKELKLRLLNGTHTFNCCTAFLSGFNITRHAMVDSVYGAFTRKLMFDEIAPSVPFPIDKKVKEDFASKVFERFCNPYIDHQWQSIAVQCTSKMKMRNVPLLQKYFGLNSDVPVHMATGFAAYLLYMKATVKEGGKYLASRNGELYEIKDDAAEYFYQVWQTKNPDKVSEFVMQNEELWGTDLTKLPGLLKAVQQLLNEFQVHGVLNTVARIELKKAVV